MAVNIPPERIEQNIQNALKSIPPRFRGPGGCVAIIKDGKRVGERIWGYADIDARIAMNETTKMPICSITKQMICALLIDLERNPTPAMAAKGSVKDQFSDALGKFLSPELIQKNGLTIEDLCDNHSGLRDYWALTVLWGARPGGTFNLNEDAVKMRSLMKSLQFEPGTQYSYSNTNFHILARIIESVTNESINSLLVNRLFKPAKMHTARFYPDTLDHPGPCVGYEGNEQIGYIASVPQIQWSGDAGAAASLDAMTAYEAYLEASFSDPTSWYHKVSQPSAYRDGTASRYHNGLFHVNVGGVATIGHGGALPGFRLHRLHAPKEHLSILVMLNHEADAGELAEKMIREVLEIKADLAPPAEPSGEWFGNFLDQETQLFVSVSVGNKDEVLITYAGHPESIEPTDAKHCKSSDMVASIEGDVLHIQRLEDNGVIYATRLVPNKDSEATVFSGLAFYCAEIESTLTTFDDGGFLYGYFDGFLGAGPAQPIRYIGGDVWALHTARSLDAPAPGEWTLVFKRDGAGEVCGVTIGCWLARKLEFVRA